MITLVRHGRTEANASGLLLGRADPPLDDLGRRQAVAVGEAVAAGGPVDRIITSPLTRARQTAEAVAAAHAAAGGRTLEVAVDDRLVELDYGTWDRRPAAEVAPREWAVWMADPSFAPPGGESLTALGARVRELLAEVAVTAADAPDVHTVLVSHVSPIKAAVAWALGVGDGVAWRLFLSPASISTVAVVRGVTSLRRFNDTSHLAGLR